MKKVFEVTTEHYVECGSKEITKTVQYVTSEENTLMSVADHFTRHCMEYEKDLVSVREVLVITEQVKKPACPFEEYQRLYSEEWTDPNIVDEAGEE